ncbi:MAG: hypothetical protein R3Y27_02785 [Clostridia bacterium]
MSQLDNIKGLIKSHKTQIAVLLLVVILSTVTLVFTFSRYVMQDEDDQISVPANFYFLSDYLVEGGATYTVYTPSTEFLIKNNDSVNVTENDIIYTVEYTAIDENGNEVTTATLTDLVLMPILEDRQYTLSALGEEDEIMKSSNSYLLSAPTGVCVTVSATSSKDYTKTLSATFEFVDAENESFYQVIDYGYYCELIIYTGENVEDITIDYGEDIAPNNMDDAMFDWKEQTTGIYEVGVDIVRNGYYVFVFFEEVVADYAQLSQTLIGEDNTIYLAIEAETEETQSDSEVTATATVPSSQY